ncbi:MAG TPA: EVE domain-containing protein [Myxococcota bacterium]|nr:EVE domain-containing protein [Myxococcota bacterium]
MSGPRCWLMKSEPSVYAIDDLRRDGATGWEGVRNYQARNMLRDDTSVGDLVLFYHSSADRIGVAGVAEIVRAGYPDPTQFDPTHTYHDPAATPDKPRWYRVDIGFVERFADVVTLDELKADPALDGMLVLKRGMRLSVQPVEPAHFERVRALGRAKGEVQA